MKRELHNLFLYLNEDRFVTINYLAEKLQVSKVTVVRYLRVLQNQDEQIIITKEGRYGGVRLVKGYSIPKKNFTAKQINILLKGLQLLEKVDEDLEIQVVIDTLTSLFK